MSMIVKHQMQHCIHLAKSILMTYHMQALS